MTAIERVEIAMARLLLSATSVDRDVREEADDAVKNLIAENERLRRAGAHRRKRG